MSVKLLLTVPECSALTGLSQNLIRGAINSGQLEARKMGRSLRVKRTDLDRWIHAL